MDTRVADITPREESDARSKFRGSDFQKFLHNDIVEKLADSRLKLESASLDEVQKLQGAIRELKTVLELIHAGDSAEVKKIYGR